MRFLRYGAAFAIAVLASPAPAFTLDYRGGFSDTSALRANQNYGFGPIFTQNVLRLTDGGGSQAGSVFTREAVPVATFRTSFVFRMYAGSAPRADGMTFTIQAQGADALGGAGGGLGFGPDYAGGPLGIENSVAVKFDNYSNDGEGTNSTGLFTNGEAPLGTLKSVDLTGTGIDLLSDATYQVDIAYDGFSLDVRILDPATLAETSQTYALDLLAIVGSDYAHVGFTAGTGGLTAVTDVERWHFEGEPVPEPATLVAVALIAPFLRRRR